MWTFWSLCMLYTVATDAEPSFALKDDADGVTGERQSVKYRFTDDPPGGRRAGARGARRVRVRRVRVRETFQNNL